MPLRVLVCCEVSQIEQQAFASAGCVSYSLDIQPTYGPDPSHHICDDAYTFPLDGWDLIVAHPPCTYLTHANNARRGDPGFVDLAIHALRLWFRLLFESPCPVCVENPVGIPSEVYPATQIICPSQFGEPFRKRTCLWLRDLPPLMPTGLVLNPRPWVCSSKYNGAASSQCPGLSRSAARSQSFAGVASAMASQWVPFLENKKNA